MRNWLCPLVIGCCLASPSLARDIFVSNTAGDDRFSGLLEKGTGAGDGPVRTLTQALRLADKGDRIVMANTGRPYRESVSLVGGKHAGDVDRPFIILGNGAVLDGSFPVPPRAWEHYRDDVFRFAPPQRAFQQLFLNGRPAVRHPVRTIDVAPPKLEPLEWCLAGGYLYFRIEPGKLIDDYRLTAAGHQVGITLYQVRHVAIFDLVVQGFQLDGINAHDGVRHCTLAGVTARGNGRSGVAVCGSSRVEINGCLLGDNGQAQLYTQDLAEVRVVNSDLLPASAPEVLQHGGKVVRAEASKQ
ncbi:MAG: right-handed parallel beta-helix repeat-containing protein [Pirellulales bacterium]